MDFSKVKKWVLPEGDAVAVHDAITGECLWKLESPIAINLDEVNHIHPDFEWSWFDDSTPFDVIENDDGSTDLYYGDNNSWSADTCMFIVRSYNSETWGEIKEGSSVTFYPNFERMNMEGYKLQIVINEKVNARIYYNGINTVSAYWNYPPITIEIYVENGVGKIRTLDSDGMGSTSNSPVDFTQGITIAHIKY